MFLSMRRYNEAMTQVRRLLVKVTLQGHAIYPLFRFRFVSPVPFEQLLLDFTQMFLSVRRVQNP